MRVAGLLAVVSLAAGCHVNAEAKASTNGDARADMKAETEESPAPPPAATTEAAPAPAPAPVAAAPECPIACYAASGAARLAVTPDEQTRLSSALGPVFVRMQACSEGARGPAPTLNLRIAPNGALADLGVDPRHGGSEACVESAARESAVDLALPGRTDVRCREECAKPAAQASGRAPRRAKKKR